MTALDINSFFASIQSTLVTIGTTLIVIALVALGIKAIVTFHKQGSIREVFSGAGVIFIGAIFIGAATAIAALISSFASQIK